MNKRKIFSLLAKKGIFMASLPQEKDIAWFFKALKPSSVDKLIRIGGEKDGGYVVPNVLSGIKFCFSPGVDKTCTFEKELSLKYEITSYLADNSVEAPPEELKSFIFLKKNIATYNDDENIEINTWFDLVDKNEDFILQMDIEGDEYSTLLATSRENLDRARVIVLELHYLHLIFSISGNKILKSFVKKLLENHTVVFLNPNNNEEPYEGMGFSMPSVLEVTLVRNDYLALNNEPFTYPHPMNIVNNPNKKPITLDNRFFN